MLKAIGWWIETLADEESPAPQELVGELPSEVRTALANYLAGGLRLIQYRGRFSGPDSVSEIPLYTGLVEYLRQLPSSK